MAQEDLKKAIFEKAEEEKGDILAQARGEVQNILKKAEEEARALRDGYLEEIKKNGLLRKTRDLSKIALELKRGLLEGKEKKITEVLALARENFKFIRQDRDLYRVIFKNLLEECLEDIERDIPLKLKTNPSDKELALEILKELRLHGEIENVDISGGVILSDLDGTKIILNTFTSRLEKLERELRQDINKILFA